MTEVERFQQLVRLANLREGRDTMTNIEELHILVKRLDGLLSDPHPGLFSWQEAYRRNVKDLLSFWGAMPGEPGKVHEYSPHEDNEE